MELSRELWSMIKDDKENRILYFYIIMAIPLSHWIIFQMNSQLPIHFMMGAFQAMALLMLVGNSVSKEGLNIQKKMIEAQESLIKNMEQRDILQKNYQKHLEDTLSAYRGHPEVHADGLGRTYDN